MSGNREGETLGSVERVEDSSVVVVRGVGVFLGGAGKRGKRWIEWVR